VDITLTSLQYQLVVSSLAGALATLGGAALYFIVRLNSLKAVHRPAVALAAVVCAIAAFHYTRILGSWENAFAWTGEAWEPTGLPFSHAYRYADWLLTVPILVVQLVLVLRLPKAEARRLGVKLAAAAGLMVAVGFPGEIASDSMTKLIFWTLGMVPFLYLVYVLWVEMGASLMRQHDSVLLTISNARWTLVTTWLVYPIVYLFPVLGLDSLVGEMGRQIGYSISDVIAKAGYGLIILRIASLKSELTDEEEARGSSLLASLKS
jgi:bacteriorhodopsin